MKLKAHFQRFLTADPDRLHVAAHSHHFWPDVTFEAQQRCWDDAARLADRKWEMIFSEIYPACQLGVAKRLALPNPGSLAFGPNTHGFLLRLLSCLPHNRPSHVLTSDGEFHSFARQIARLEEDGLAQVTRVPSEPFADFSSRFAVAAAQGGFDMIYLSQVFYNSGYALPDLAAIVAAVKDREALVVIDGYHGFMARPTDLSAIADRIFYLAGGYKYAMAGEGVVFLHAPDSYGPRPRDTGWYAAFGALESGEGGRLGYAAGGARFLGATFDPVGLYRQAAVFAWLEREGITVDAIHSHVHGLQDDFIKRLHKLQLAALQPAQLVVAVAEPNRGNFLTFRTAQAAAIHRELLARKIITDYRGDRLRFGFGLYHDETDLERLIAVLKQALS